MTRKAWIFVNIVCSFAAGAAGVVIILVIFSLTGSSFMVNLPQATKSDATTVNIIVDSTSTGIPDPEITET